MAKHLKAHIPFTFFTFVVVVSRYFLADRLVRDMDEAY